MEKLYHYCQTLENLFNNKDKYIFCLKESKEFPCFYIDELKNLKAFNFDFIKEKIDGTLHSADALIIFEDFILLIEFKNPYYDKAISLDEKLDAKDRDRILREKLREIIEEKYKPVIEDSIKICKKISNKEDISKYLWIGFLVEFTNEFLENLDYMKKLKKLASKKKQYEMLEKQKEEIFYILEKEFKNIDKSNFYELSLWDCSKFYNPFFYLYKKHIICPK